MSLSSYIDPAVPNLPLGIAAAVEHRGTRTVPGAPAEPVQHIHSAAAANLLAHLDDNLAGWLVVWDAYLDDVAIQHQRGWF